MSNLASAIGSGVRANKGLVRLVDTEDNIKNRSTDPTGSIALGSDTSKIYIHLGSGSWVVINTAPA